MRWMLALLLAAGFGSAVTLHATDAEPLPPRYDVTSTDPVDAVRQIAGRHEHGSMDNLSPWALDTIALERKVRSTCTFVSDWAVTVLDRAGIEARVVSTLTLDEWDEDNNGHTMIEVRVDGRWVLFDVDRDVWFWRDGRPLSLVELVAAVPSGGYEIRSLSGDPTRPENDLRLENVRLLQVPIVRDDDGLWFFSDHADRVHGYSVDYRELSEADWMARFY